VRRLPYAGLFVILACLVVVPVVLVIITALTDTVPRPGAALGSFTFHNVREVLSGTNLTATVNSASIALGGTAIALVIGAALAWLAARTDIPGRAFVQLVGITPLFMPTLIGALAWSFLASPRAGYLNMVLGSLHIPVTLNIYSVPGMIFVFGLYYTPYAFMFIFAALALMNPELEQAAAVHGASNARIARTVTLPLMFPAILGASLLTFVLILQNFPVPQILGTPGHVNTLPSLIFRLMNNYPPDANSSAAVGLLMMVIMTIFIVVQRRLIAAREYRTVTGKGLRARRVRLGRWKWLALALIVLYALFGVVLPVVALANTAFRKSTYIPDTRHIIDPSQFSLLHFHALFNDDTFIPGLRNSIITGLAAALLGTLLHVLMSYTTYRTRRRGRGLIEFAAMIPLAVPALVLGLGIFWAALRFSVGIYGTLFILILAFMVQFMPQGFRSASAGMMQIHPELEEAARVSGAGRSRTIAEVMVPMLRSGIFSTMLLLFILSVGEVSAAIFLFSSNTVVTSVNLYNLYSDGLIPEAAALSLVFSGFLLIVVVATRRWLAGREPS
jgi:iron(III) transport system permease protein